MMTKRMTKRSSQAGSGQGRRGPVRGGYKVLAPLLKPGSLWTCGPSPSPTATPGVSNWPHILALIFKPTSKM